MTKAFAPIASQQWGGFRKLGAERVLIHNLIVGGGTLSAGVLGVAFQSLVSHQLNPADYGSVFAVVTLLTFIGLPASAFTLLMAREASRGQASGNQAPSANLLRRGNMALLLFGATLACLIAVTSRLVARFLAIPPELLIVASLAVPFSLAFPLLLGELQGEQRFVAFSVLLTGQAAVKLVAAVGLGLVFGLVGVVGGISIATITIYLVVWRMLSSRLATQANLPWWRPAVKYLAVVLPSTVALAVLLSADVLVVKHFFPTRAAGEYSAVAALGRAIFWGASGVAAVLFPKVVLKNARGTSGSYLVAASLGLVVIGGLAGFAFLGFGSRWLLTAFAGGAYVGAAAYLPWYAVGMTLLGGVAVLIATHQSQGRATFLVFLLPLTALEPVLLSVFHANLLQMVQVLDVANGLILASLGILYMGEERLRRIVFDQALPDNVAEQAVIEMVANR